jgi:hypothetical protein
LNKIEQPVRLLKGVARQILESANGYSAAHRELRKFVRIEKRTRPQVVEPSRVHLETAMAWLKKAQDASDTGGVCWGYRARRPIRTDLTVGWVPAYPETTGYIISTMLRYADWSGDEECIRRARRMTDWELSIQLEDGGFQGGIIGENPVSSSTFVTGQVLFGLVAADERFREDSIRVSALRAGEYLLECLDETGRFVKGYSHFCEPGPKAYEVRTGFALALLGNMLGDQRFQAAASRIADYAISMQQANGWFAENDLDLHDQPLTHTIGYVMEGLSGIGEQLGRSDCFGAVCKTLDSIAPLIRSDGFLAGRWRSDWKTAADWACLTGSAQIAGVFLGMYARTRNRDYYDAGRKLLGFACFTLDSSSGVPANLCGIRGSYPFGGPYGQWCVLNWATKFFADSVMDYLDSERRRQ